MRSAFTSRFYKREQWFSRAMTGRRIFPRGDSDSRYSIVRGKRVHVSRKQRREFESSVSELDAACTRLLEELERRGW